MTDKADEKAREIVGKLIVERCTGDGDCTRLENFIAAALREAVLDDRNERTAEDLYKLSYQNGYSKALEEAAKVAFESCENTQSKRICTCARAIRRLGKPISDSSLKGE